MVTPPAGEAVPGWVAATATRPESEPPASGWWLLGGAEELKNAHQTPAPAPAAVTATNTSRAAIHTTGRRPRPTGAASLPPAGADGGGRCLGERWLGAAFGPAAGPGDLGLALADPAPDATIVGPGGPFAAGAGVVFRVWTPVSDARPAADGAAGGCGCGAVGAPDTTHADRFRDDPLPPGDGVDCGWPVSAWLARRARGLSCGISSSGGGGMGVAV